MILVRNRQKCSRDTRRGVARRCCDAGRSDLHHVVTTRGRRHFVEQIGRVVAPRVHARADGPSPEHAVRRWAQQCRRIAIRLAEPYRPVRRLQHDRHPVVNGDHERVRLCRDDAEAPRRLAGGPAVTRNIITPPAKTPTALCPWQKWPMPPCRPAGYPGPQGRRGRACLGHVSRKSHSLPITQRRALSLPLSIPHSKSVQGPRFSIPTSSSVRLAAAKARAQTVSTTVF
jgi:hypothetical protein